MSEAIEALSFSDYLVAEEKASERHEFVGGRRYLQAGGTERHDLMAGLLYEAFAPGARAAGCRTFIHNRRLQTPAGNTYYPDVFIACGVAGNEQYETVASLIAEVVSPSTAGIDRPEKLAAYSPFPSLERYLVVEPEIRRIEAYDPRSRSWQLLIPGSVLFTSDGEIDVEALSDELDHRATT